MTLIGIISVFVVLYPFMMVFQVLERDDDENVEDRAMTAMGLLNTIESLVNVLEENKPIMQQLEPVILSIVGYVLQNNSQGHSFNCYQAKF